MSRKSPATVLVSDLPAFLLNARDAEPVALALAAQAAATYAQAEELGGASDLVLAAIRTQADELNEAAHAVREFPQRLANASRDDERKPAERRAPQHNPNTDGVL